MPLDTLRLVVRREKKEVSTVCLLWVLSLYKTFGPLLSKILPLSLFKTVYSLRKVPSTSDS